MENVLFKISFPAEFHAQTAAECAMQLHPRVKDRISEIERITIRTQEAAIRIIDKKFAQQLCRPRPLYSIHRCGDPCFWPAYGCRLRGRGCRRSAYRHTTREDDLCRRPAVHARLSRSQKRSIANGLTVEFKNGEKLDEVVMEYPLGHRLRRNEGIPLLETKFEANLARVFPRRSTRSG